MSELRLFIGFVAGMLTPLAPYLSLQAWCSGDLCLGLWAYLFGAVPAGLAAGAVAGVAAPRLEGRLGWLLATLGVYVGVVLWDLVLSGAGGLGALLGVLLVGTPIALASSVGFGIVRLLRRLTERPAREEPGTSGPQAPSREP